MALRERPYRAQPSKRRPVWGIIAVVVAGMVVLFGVGFGIATVIKNARNDTAAEATATLSANPLPCASKMITPAEVLPPASKVIINVYNGTKRAGLAAQTADVFVARGFKVKKVGNDPNGQPVMGVGELRFGPKGAEGAHRLTYYMPGVKLVEITRNTKRIDVVLGQDFVDLVPDNEVAASMASPTPTYLGPGCPGSPAPKVDVTNSATPSPSTTPSPN